MGENGERFSLELGFRSFPELIAACYSVFFCQQDSVRGENPSHYHRFHSMRKMTFAGAVGWRPFMCSLGIVFLIHRGPEPEGPTPWMWEGFVCFLFVLIFISGRFYS